jgi:hypothetical protein
MGLAGRVSAKVSEFGMRHRRLQDALRPDEKAAEQAVRSGQESGGAGRGIPEPAQYRFQIARAEVIGLTGFHPNLGARENIYLSGAILGTRRHKIAIRFDEIVALADVERRLLDHIP